MVFLYVYGTVQIIQEFTEGFGDGSMRGITRLAGGLPAWTIQHDSDPTAFFKADHSAFNNMSKKSETCMLGCFLFFFFFIFWPVEHV
ncbi:Uncharacterized protein TCM_035430 [Theobroma cacao]|uniref:Uncharacterized protein n=1 Tax=Theobroma cacao TaxID=3641 RepID=A0A061FIW6_THECC|nr:Uncharacterized protein TCM_035430 [Theobroma cacao]